MCALKRVAVLDYGSGNLRSAHRALERVGAEVTVTADARIAAEAEGLVVPGVGAYAACMRGLVSIGGDDIVGGRVADGRPVLGICVGMQVMFDAGVEHGVETKGLGLFSGRVEHLHADVVPHMGWNTLTPADGSVLFADADPETRYYFVHSYAAHPSTGSAAGVTTAVHGERFVAAVESGVLSATQFHPEKSGDAGARMLANWLRTL